MNKHLLLVEDEPILSETLAAYLRKAGYSVDTVLDGAAAMPAFKRTTPALVLLDLMLPTIDGLTLCRQIREKSQVPIIMVTARVDEVDRLLGLEIGADDYVCKPYSPREVVARVKAVLRRTSATSEVLDSESQSSLRIDEKAMEAQWNGQSLALTAIEFRLLYAMAREPRRVFSREQLMNQIYNDHRIVSERTIDSHITKLRRKLMAFCDGQDIIRSVYGAGYKFERPF